MRRSSLLFPVFQRTTLVMAGCAAFVSGIAMARHNAILSPIAGLYLLPLIFVLRRRSWLSLLWIGAFGLAIGWGRGSLYVQKLQAISAHYNQKVVARVVASQDGVYGKTKQLVFDVQGLQLQPSGERLTGKFSVSGFGENVVLAGDVLEVRGKLKASLGSYQGRMSFAQLQVIRHHPTVVTDLRRRFASGLQSTVPEPLGSFGMGLLIGQRNTLPVAVSQDLLMIGLTHIIAASGYNLMIILRSVDKVVGRRSKRLTVLIAAGLITLFLLMAGNSASIVRAAIVSGLSIVAGYSGRQFKPLVLIGLAAVVSGYMSPYYVWSDAGWALSFLAFYGVLLVSPLIHDRLSPRWRDSLLIAVGIESVSAEFMAGPYLLHTFGQLSFIGLLANMLVAVLVPLAMLLSLIAGLAGILLPAVAGWFAWPATLLMNYMLDVSHLLAGIPHIYVDHIGLTTWQMIFWYIVIIGLVSALQYKSKRAIITEIHSVKRGAYVRTQQVVNNQT